MISQYLERYAEVEARALLESDSLGRWDHVLVIPAYRETPDFLERLTHFSSLLVIVVLNRPDDDGNADCNDSVRDYVEGRAQVTEVPCSHARLFHLAQSIQVLLVERPQPLPSKEGVGLARKLGCDLALALMARERIESPWIHSSDADAALPEDYFTATQGHEGASALAYPYRHSEPDEGRERKAMAAYEAYLYQYVDGLRAAGSPYAFHTLGSCIAVHANAYAQVRGFPRRAGGEDFYLLNKLAKVGNVITPNSQPIRLSARVSDRVPFGTGPALSKLLAHTDAENVALFHHPQCFADLGVLLKAVEKMDFPGDSLPELMEVLQPYPHIVAAIQALGMHRFFDHAARQCQSRDEFVHQFHQWFDGFRTLKFVRALSRQRGLVSSQQLIGGSDPSLSKPLL